MAQPLDNGRDYRPTENGDEMRIISRVCAVTFLVILAMGSAVVPASAAGARNGVALQQAREVQGLLVHNPSSVQISADAVRLSDGSVITVFTKDDAVVPNSASGRCAGGHLCLFANSNWGGDQWTSSATSCAAVNLFNYFMGNGKSWADQASSIDNPLPRPAGQAQFFHNNQSIAYLQPGHYLRNLATDGYNDRIESLYPCGH
jgi:hypothetical protein